MSIKVGGTGVDFPNVANEMIVNDYDWTPEQAEQSEGRLYRISSEQDVNVHYMISNDTIDQEIFDIVQQKRKIAELVQKWRGELGGERNDQARQEITKLNRENKSLDGAVERAAIEELKKAQQGKIGGTGNNWYGR
jgi:SNF2 family DNA or RNA helicase